MREPIGQQEPKVTSSSGALIQAKADRFWNWFSKNARDLAAQAGSPSLQAELTNRLQAVSENLVWQAEKVGTIWQFEVSADGDLALFPVVEELVSLAPEIPGWKILAFRQRDPNVRSISFQGASLSAENVRFSAVDFGDQVDLILFIRGDAATAQSERTRSAAILLIDGLVGEFEAATKIRCLDTAPSAHSTSDSLPLLELGRVLSTKRGIYKRNR